MKIIRVKAHVVSEPCPFRGICPHPCEWCNTHSYSEACVPMMVKKISDLQKSNARKSDTIKALCESRTEIERENRQLREKLGIDDLW